MGLCWCPHLGGCLCCVSCEYIQYLNALCNIHSLWNHTWDINGWNVTKLTSTRQMNNSHVKYIYSILPPVCKYKHESVVNRREIILYNFRWFVSNVCIFVSYWMWSINGQEEISWSWATYCKHWTSVLLQMKYCPEREWRTYCSTEIGEWSRVCNTWGGGWCIGSTSPSPCAPLCPVSV